MAEEIRRSQIITTYGIGAVNELKDFTGVIKSPEIWSKQLIQRLEEDERVDDARLAKALNVNYFLMPPRKQEKNSAYLPLALFPRMLFCPSTNILKSVEDWVVSNDISPWNLVCPSKKKVKLIPSRFITICPHGHMDDFPYYKWVHEYKECKYPNRKHEFTIRSSGGGSSLGDIWIKCVHCNKSKSMSGALDAETHVRLIKKSLGENAVEEITCEGNRPELFKNRPEFSNCGINIRHLRFVLRNATNVHFPRIFSSLLIPPFSDDLYEKIQKLDLYYDYKNALKKNEKVLEYKEQLKNTAKLKFKLENDQIDKILDDLLNKDSEYEEEKYRSQEYSAFVNADEFVNTSNFIISSKNVDKLKKFKINTLYRVDKLRMLNVFYGFSRVQPYDNTQISDDDLETRPQIELIRINKEFEWLPGVEHFGEGVFISFENEFMSKMEIDGNIQKRFKLLKNNLDNFVSESNINFGNINARYVAIHTLAHFLIKQIAFESGYAIAALKERIYVNVDREYPIMNGLLIYVAEADSVGTLGGLCRLADDTKLTEIFDNILVESEWCSSDPVCRESKGQGMGSLNLAACHSCTLLPETSCERGNRFLDRTLMEYILGH